MPDHKTFCAFGAYAVDVKDPHKIVVMALANAADEGKQIDPSKFVTLNLQQRLGVKGVPFDDAILDTLGMVPNDDGEAVDKPVRSAFPTNDLRIKGIDVLTIGPVFPGQHVGGIYMVREKFFKEIRPLIDPDPAFPGERMWPHAGLHTYQFMSSASRDDNTVSRYHGFLAIVRVDKGTVKTLEISTSPNKPPIRFDVDMNNRAECDDPVFLAKEVQDPLHPESPETVLNAQSQLNDQGAIFLPLSFCVANNLTSPKEPPGGGGLPPGRFDPVSISVSAKGPGHAETTSTPNRTFVNAGDLGKDSFARSVFEKSLKNTKAQKLEIRSTESIRSTELAALQGQLDEFDGSAHGHSLDIIADAPGGIQQIDNSTVVAIAKLSQNRFTQCRLLGCVTALESEGRTRMLELANELGVPVFGTLRAIAFPDFGDMSFHDKQMNGDVEVSIMISTHEMASGIDPEKEKDIASGRIQQQWLDGFHPVKVEPEDLEGEPPSDAKPWRMPDELLSSPVAATDQIHTAAAGVIALHTRAGAVRCEVLACATLLRLRSKTHGWIYVNIPPNSDVRRELLPLIR
jgi:hypothetical protein